jgi:hypothetical protein
VTHDSSLTLHRTGPAVAVSGGIALLMAVILYLSTGPTLGLFFGGVVIVTLLLPPMVTREHLWLPQGLVASTLTDAVALVWLLAVFTTDTTLLQWLACYVLLVAYAFALWAVVRFLHALNLPAIPASALTLTLAAMWLTWPIWLARAVNDAMVSLLVPPHPLLAINGVLRHLGIWSEHAIAYRHLMNLGQDVAYQLPPGILPSVFVHLIVGGVLFALSALRRAGPESPGHSRPVE